MSPFNADPGTSSLPVRQSAEEQQLAAECVRRCCPACEVPTVLAMIGIADQQ